jgi:hypothetical protein
MSNRRNVGRMEGKSAAVASAPLPNVDSTSYEPRTPLGHRLWELRKQIIASGERLLSWEEIEREVAERKGGCPDPAK